MNTVYNIYKKYYRNIDLCVWIDYYTHISFLALSTKRASDQWHKSSSEHI